jgi:hypothetical protein
MTLGLVKVVLLVQLVLLGSLFSNTMKSNLYVTDIMTTFIAYL